MITRRLLPKIILAGLGAAAYGSSATPSAPASTQPSSTAPATPAAAQVAGNWAAFFSAKTPAAKRLSLLGLFTFVDLRRPPPARS